MVVMAQFLNSHEIFILVKFSMTDHFFGADLTTVASEDYNGVKLPPKYSFIGNTFSFLYFQSFHYDKVMFFPKFLHSFFISLNLFRVSPVQLLIMASKQMPKRLARQPRRIEIFKVTMK